MSSTSTLDMPANYTLPFPAQWLITSHASPSTCAGPQKILLTFGITNLLSSLIIGVCSHQAFIRYISFQKLRGDNVTWSWVLPLVLQLIGNALVGVLIKGTPGYSHISVLDILLIYLIRPRASFIVMTLLRVVGQWGTWLRDKHGAVKQPYWNGFVSTAASEVVLEVAAGIFTVVTWCRAGVITPPADTTKWVYPVLFVEVCLLLARPVATVIGSIMFVKRTGEPHALAVPVWFFTAVLGYVHNWVLLTHLVEHSHGQWCPPKLELQGVILAASTIIGTFLGVAA